MLRNVFWNFLQNVYRQYIPYGGLQFLLHIVEETVKLTIQVSIHLSGVCSGIYIEHSESIPTPSLNPHFILKLI